MTSLNEEKCRANIFKVATIKLKLCILQCEHFLLNNNAKRVYENLALKWTNHEISMKIGKIFRRVDLLSNSQVVFYTLKLTIKKNNMQFN